MRKYTGKDAEVFALLCQKSNELEKQGLSGTKLFKALVKFYEVAKEQINKLDEPVQYTAGSWFD